MAYVLDTFRQGLAYLFVYSARDVDAGEGAVDGQDAVQTTTFAFFYEFGAVGGFGCDMVGCGNKGVPVFFGIGTVRWFYQWETLDTGH